MRRLSLLLVATSALLAGCNASQATLTAPPGSRCAPGTRCAGGVTPGTPVKVDPIGTLEFKALASGNAKYLGTGGGGIIGAGAGNFAGGTSAASAPALGASQGAAGPTGARASGVTGPNLNTKPVAPPAGPGPAPKGGAVSGNLYGDSSYSYYFGGFGLSSSDGTPLALVALTQAETTGSKGTFQDVLKGVVAPVVKQWAADARLVESSAILDGKGALYPDANPAGARLGDVFTPYGQGGYHFVYVSPTRGEVLNFNVLAAKTVILRLSYAPLDLAPEAVLVDSSSAIAKLTAAIKDPAFQSVEERTSLDYFLGFPYNQPYGGGMVDGPGSRSEVVYDVPADARWNVQLQQVLGKAVWNLSFDGNPSQFGYGGVGIAGTTSVGFAGAGTVTSGNATSAGPAIAVAAGPGAPTQFPAPGGGGDLGSSSTVSFNNYATGMVDAATGAVIRFSRPTKFTWSYGGQGGGIAPQPMPAQPAASGSVQPQGL